MKKSLFALAFIASFVFSASEFEMLEKECDGGNVKSCIQAGALYIYGDNPAKGVKILKKTCDKGNSESCRFLGNQYLQCDIIQKDMPKAIAYLDKSCDGRYQMGCSSLSWMYDEKRILKKRRFIPEKFVI